MTRMVQLVRMALFAALTLGTTQALAYDGYISTSGKLGVVISVRNFASATGWGAHFSTSSSTDGYGGYDAECHINEGSGQVTVLCYDGYQDSANHTNQFQLDLGDKARIVSVTFTIRPQEVRVDAVRYATNPYTSERKAYTSTSVFPIRQSSGFWRGGTIYYQANSVLAGCGTGRCGSGYIINSITSY